MAETRQQEQAQAAPKQGSTQEPASGQAGQSRPCPKDCSKCSMQHQVYCAAKMTFDSFSVMNVIIQRLDIQSQRIADLEQRIAAIQSTEAEFSAPLPLDGDLFAET